MLKVGLVGCGGIAQVHARVLHELQEVTFCACADVKPERAEKMAATYGCHAYASLEAMLDAEQLDAVHLCTPHYLHTPMAEMCAERGVAVFTEKPPVIDREQWARLLAAGEKTPIGVCFQNRFNPNVEEAMRIVRSGEYGAVKGARGIVTWNRNAPYYTNSDWRGRWATEGGGALMNQSVHTLDLLIRFTGPAEELEAHMANHHLRGVSEEEDTVEAFWHNGDKRAVFFVSTAYAADAPVLIEVALERATLRMMDDCLTVTTTDGSETKAYPMASVFGKSYWGGGHLACIREFYEALLAGRPCRNDLASVADTVEALLRIYEIGRPQLG